MSRSAAGFDPALVPATDAARVVSDAAAIEKMAATVKALAAAHVAQTQVWRGDGDRSAAHHLARTTGTTAIPVRIRKAGSPRGCSRAELFEPGGVELRLDVDDGCAVDRLEVPNTKSEAVNGHDMYGVETDRVRAVG